MLLVVIVSRLIVGDVVVWVVCCLRVLFDVRVACWRCLNSLVCCSHSTLFAVVHCLLFTAAVLCCCLFVIVVCLLVLCLFVVVR